MSEEWELDHYLNRIRKIPMMTAAEERAAFDEIAGLRAEGKDGEGRLRFLTNRVVEANLRFVVSVARKYRGMGLPLSDLIEEGNLGLIEAAGRFDPGRNLRFLSYAVWWIRQSVTKALTDKGRTIRIPARALAKGLNQLEVREHLLSALGREPGDEDVAAFTGGSPESVRRTVGLPMRHASLDAERAGDKGGHPLVDLIRDESMPGSCESAVSSLTREAVERSLSILPERDALVVRLRHGLDGGKPMTLSEVGVMLGISKERVRQLQGRAEARLGDAAELRKLAGKGGKS